METREFTFNGIPIKIERDLRKCQVELPYPSNPALTLRILAISPTTNLQKGSLAPKITEQIIDPQGKIVDRAATPSTTYLQKPEDYDYFYYFTVTGSQKLGEVIDKQMINGILENSPLKINVYSHTGEFLQPITFTAVYENDAITVTPQEYDNALNLEYSFDDGATWQAENTLASPADGDYAIQVRYAGKELRVGKSFKAIQQMTITVAPEVIDPII